MCEPVVLVEDVDVAAMNFKFNSSFHEGSPRGNIIVSTNETHRLIVSEERKFDLYPKTSVAYRMSQTPHASHHASDKTPPKITVISSGDNEISIENKYVSPSICSKNNQCSSDNSQNVSSSPRLKDQCSSSENQNPAELNSIGNSSCSTSPNYSSNTHSNKITSSYPKKRQNNGKSSCSTCATTCHFPKYPNTCPSPSKDVSLDSVTSLDGNAGKRSCQSNKNQLKSPLSRSCQLSGKCNQSNSEYNIDCNKSNDDDKSRSRSGSGCKRRACSLESKSKGRN